MHQKFEYDQVMQKINKIRDINKKVKSILAQTDRIMNEKVGNPAVWSGEAASSVKQKWQNCSSNFKSFTDELETYAIKMENAGTNFHSFEENNG